MDSLLSCYASDEEEEKVEEVQERVKETLQPAKTTTRSAAEDLEERHPPGEIQPIRGSKPPVPSPASSILSSLPPPKSQASKVAFHGPSQPFRTPPPSSTSSSSQPPHTARTSLLAALPPPKSGTSLSSVGNGGSAGGKRVITFQVPVNMAALTQEDKDEEEEDERKRRKLEAEKKANSTAGTGGKRGFAALLPPPKQSLGLGSGVMGAGSGRRLGAGSFGGEQGLDLDDGLGPFKKHQKTEDWRGMAGAEAASAGASGMGSDALPHARHLAPFDSMAGSAASDAATAAAAAWPAGTSAQYGATADVASLGTVGHETHQSYAYDQLQGGGAFAAAAEVDAGAAGLADSEGSFQGASSVPDGPWGGEGEEAGHAWMGGTKKREREAKMMAAAGIVEVKQADLTKNAVREDQLKSTGIAFGPSYQPVPSGSGKPSKVHRRKHQIGSLYFDMRQKEMELLERRSRGMLTKAQTQGKYGW